MSIKLTDTQLVLLGAAALRKDLCLVAPPTLKGATAQKVASKLISAGFVRCSGAGRSPGASNPDHSAPGLGFRLSYDTNCQIKS